MERMPTLVRLGELISIAEYKGLLSAMDTTRPIVPIRLRPLHDSAYKLLIEHLSQIICVGVVDLELSGKYFIHIIPWNGIYSNQLMRLRDVENYSKQLLRLYDIDALEISRERLLSLEPIPNKAEYNS